MLQLAALAVPVDDVPWLEPPAPHAVERANDLLNGLDAVGEDGELTQVGAAMAKLPMHPRLSRLLVEAAARRCLERAAIWAALISERTVRRGPAAKAGVAQQPLGSSVVSDLEALERLFLAACELDFEPAACERAGISASASREVDATCRLYLRRAKAAGLTTPPPATGSKGDTSNLVKCLLVAFFDRVAVRRDGENLLCAMAGQKRVEIDPASEARACPIVVAVEIRETESVTRSEVVAGNRASGGNGVRTVLSMASGLEPEWLEEVHPGKVGLSSETVWNSGDQAVEQHLVQQYDGLPFHREKLTQVEPIAAEEMLVARIEQGEIALDKWDEEVDEWMNRTRLLARLFPERNLILYDASEVRLLRHEIVAGATRSSHLRKRNCLDNVQNALDWKDQQFVRKMAPTRLPLPSGQGLRIRYFATEPPRGRARIQDLYGLQKTPSIAAGRQPLILEILGPNFRPVQVTDDLSGFWRTTYPEVKKELKRRYPKHDWR